MQENLFEQISYRFKRLCLFQLGVTFLVFGLGSLLAVKNQYTRLYSPDVLWTIILLFLVVFISLIYYQFWGKSYQSVVQIAMALLVMDILIVTLIVHCSGGIDSLFSSLYLLIIAGAGIVVSRKASLKAAIICSAAYSSLVVLEYYQIFWDSSMVRETYSDLAYVLYVLLFKSFLFFLAAFLTMYFINEINVGSRKLSDLTMLHDVVINTMKTGMLILDDKKKIIMANPSAMSILGLSWQELNQRTLFDIFPQNEVEKLKYLLSDEYKRAEKTANYELCHRKGSQDVDIGFNVSPLKDSHERELGFIFLLQDISAKKNLEKTIARIDKNNALSKMAETIAHELRNPLASLLGSAEVLKEKVKTDEVSGKLFDVIIKESRRLNKIVANFLEISHVSSPEFNVVDLKELIDEVVLILRNHAKMPTNAYFEQNVLPGEKVLGDADQLKQVFNNLIFNAIEASLHETDGDMRVQIYAEKRMYDDKKYIAICVKDFGRGLTEEEKEQVFRPFYSTRDSGTGLGLAVVQSLVKQHGGFMDIDSSPGHGAVFSVLLPEAVG